jgi:hypothetical protein
MQKNDTRWIAKWIDRKGNAREYTFYGPSSRIAARIDFQLDCIDGGEPVPERFELEEATRAIPDIPTRLSKESGK